MTKRNKIKLFEISTVNGKKITPIIVLAQDFNEAVFKVSRGWGKNGLRPVGEFR